MNAPADNKLSAYAHNGEYLADEMAKLDIILAALVRNLRAQDKSVQSPADAHIYISDAEVDGLLNPDSESLGLPSWLVQTREQLQAYQHMIYGRVAESRRQGIYLGLPRLQEIFRLSTAETQVLLICLAPELQRKYDRVYAYLQDDITRKRASVELALRCLQLLQPEHVDARQLFAAHAPLMRLPLLQNVEDPHSPSGCSDLGRLLKLEARVVDYLLGNNTLDARLHDRVMLFPALTDLDQVMLDDALTQHCLQRTQQHLSAPQTPAQPLLWFLHGPYGVGKRDLARAVSGQLSCGLLCIDMQVLLAQEADPIAVVRLALREAALWQAALCLENMDTFIQEGEKHQALLKRLARVLGEYGWLIFMTAKCAGLSRPMFEGINFHSFALPMPSVSRRILAWQQALGQLAPGPAWAQELATRFRLTPGQMRDALATAQGQVLPPAQLALADLYNACRGQSKQKLSELAVKVNAHQTWNDLVLSDDVITQLREICAQVKHYYRVFDEWGFGARLSQGKGLSVLLSGPPGTGKTLSAEVMAKELALDLYKIDLSSVVSKYIGETEKNLNKIFQEAEASNAILFFDEADALFGKRTEVSSAHDRYANIETSYLLQKMEEYEGMVILASNLRKNLDDAFVRRLRFIVEYPFPDAQAREQIWACHLPQAAPVAANVDCAFLARKFPVAGGHIKNIVLNAAFLAAEDGGSIEMEHILRGVRREFEKIGKSWNAQEFGLERLGARRAE